MRLRTWVCLSAVALSLAACASGPPRGFDDEDEFEDGPPAPRSQLFISPSGQPFRAPGDAPYPSAAWFAAADANHDGRLTRDEHRADAEAWFKVLDRNGDGQIDMPEVTYWEEEIAPEITRPAPGRGPRARNAVDSRRQGAATYSLINEPHPIRGADADFSMGVSRAEWRAAADRRFAILDPDGDGVVVMLDLKPTPAQAMGGGGRRGGGGPPRR